MKYLNLTKSLAVAAMCSLIFTACDKANVATPMGDAGQTLVKILGGGTPAEIVKKPIDFVATPFSMVGVELRRDVASESELNKTMVITVKDDTAAVTAAGYLKFPTAWHSVTIANGVKAGGEGGTWTVTFNPGEFSKTVYINIPNATLLNPSALYGVGFTILTADGGSKLSTQKSLIVEIGAKNAYDGVYSVVSGFVQRYGGPGPTNPICCDGLTGPLGPANPDIFLITTGAYTVAIPTSGENGRLTWSGGVSGVAGIDGIRLTVDPSTNLVTSSCLGNATFANFPGSSPNYVPSTKTFNLNWRWNPTASTRDLEIVLKYKAPR